MKHRMIQTVVLLGAGILLGICCQMMKKQQDHHTEEKKLQQEWQKAASDPTTPYPETVVYKLAKMTASGDPMMPEGDTYEDNAYTRFLKDFINVQNEDVSEVSEDDNYDLYVKRLIREGNAPDVMILSDLQDVKDLTEEGALEDLTDAYENCTSDTIKEIYDSYGTELMDSVTIDGHIMALPATQVYYGCSLFWVRQDWLDELGLPAPETLDDVERIVLAFREHNMGGTGNIGLACMADLVGTGSSNYSLDPVFGAFGAYPQIWVQNAHGIYEYGSLKPETKEALAYLNQWYEKGVLDEDYMMRTTTEIGNLVKEGHCGAFFGWWWAPNSPLLASVSENPDAEWKPYLISGENRRIQSYISSKGTQYVVVRKDYEHPEVVMKIITALFDNARFQGDSTDEIDQYQTIGVDVTARPLVINCDYSDAVFRTTQRIENAFRDPSKVRKLSALERVYYEACQHYQAGEKDPDLWAAYASRVEAVDLINQADITYINQDYVQHSNQGVSQEQQDLEILSFMKIITGEEDISYFETFVDAWKKNMFLENLSY